MLTPKATHRRHAAAEDVLYALHLCPRGQSELSLFIFRAYHPPYPPLGHRFPWRIKTNAAPHITTPSTSTAIIFFNHILALSHSFSIASPANTLRRARFLRFLLLGDLLSKSELDNSSSSSSASRSLSLIPKALGSTMRLT